MRSDLVEGNYDKPHLVGKFEVTGTVLDGKLTGWGSYLYPKAMSKRQEGRTAVESTWLDDIEVGRSK